MTRAIKRHAAVALLIVAGCSGGEDKAPPFLQEGQVYSFSSITEKHIYKVLQIHKKSGWVKVVGMPYSEKEEGYADEHRWLKLDEVRHIQECSWSQQADDEREYWNCGYQ